MHNISRWKIFGSAALVFVGGMLAGAALLYSVPHHHFMRSKIPVSGKNPDPGQMFADYLSKRYGLAVEKRDAAVAAFNRMREKMKAVRAEMMPKMEAAHQDFSKEVEGFLPAEAFKRWQEDQKRRFAGFRPLRPGAERPGALPPPPPGK